MSTSIRIVGIGPGSRSSMTPQAVAALGRADVLIGQPSCLDLVRDLAENKRMISKRMSPIERSRLAIDLCLSGNEVAIVSTGDPGVYAIASTFFSYLKDRKVLVPVEIIPGITVASAAAAVLGAPLGHDFALISLADLATPWRSIERRLLAAAEADFVIVIYNPRGKVGEQRIDEMLACLRPLRQPDTPVGIVANATCVDECARITTLAKLQGGDITDESVVIIGNSETFVFGGKMITPRAYQEGVGY